MFCEFKLLKYLFIRCKFENIINADLKIRSEGNFPLIICGKCAEWEERAVAGKPGLADGSGVDIPVAGLPFTKVSKIFASLSVALSVSE